MKCPTRQDSQLILSTALQQSLNFRATAASVRLLAPRLAATGVGGSEEAF